MGVAIAPVSALPRRMIPPDGLPDRFRLRVYVFTTPGSAQRRHLSHHAVPQVYGDTGYDRLHYQAGVITGGPAGPVSRSKRSPVKNYPIRMQNTI